MTTAAVLLFDDVEVLDFAGPYETLAAPVRDGRPLVRVVAVAATPEVRCRGGLVVRRDAPLDAAAPLDLLVVPGGPGARAERVDDLAAYVAGVAKRGALVASACTGAFVLARAGLLDGIEATTHVGWRETLQRRYPSTRVVDRPLVDAGRVITAAGVIHAVLLGLYLLERLFGREIADAEARRIEWPDWRGRLARITEGGRA